MKILIAFLLLLFTAGCASGNLPFPSIQPPEPTSSALPLDRPPLAGNTLTPVGDNAGGVDQEFLTEPAPTPALPPTKTPTPTLLPIFYPKLTCIEGSTWTFGEGFIAVVNPNPPIPNRVRAAPGLNEAPVGSIQPGEKVLVLDGPRCADGAVWWQIESLEKSTVGWTIEGDQVDDWMLPYSTSGEAENFQPAPDGWAAYADEGGFELKYPGYDTACCEMTGPATGDIEVRLTLADPTTVIPDSDAPFDGMAFFIVTVERSLAFEDYLEEEKAALVVNYEIVSGVPLENPGPETQYFVGGVEGVMLEGYSWWGVDLIFLPLPNSERVLVIAMTEAFQGSFKQNVDLILSSVRIFGDDY